MSRLLRPLLPFPAPRFSAQAILMALLLIPAALPAAQLDITLEIPRLTVAEYHRPYVAVWLERPDHSVAANLAVWYDTDMKAGEGSKWLKDMRQWWRRSGRTLSMPVDGVSGATRPVGQHQIRFSDTRGPLKTLAPGEYVLFIEAARDVGGRELVSLPLRWPPTKPQQLLAQGKTELGQVRVSIKP